MNFEAEMIEDEHKAAIQTSLLDQPKEWWRTKAVSECRRFTLKEAYRMVAESGVVNARLYAPMKVHKILPDNTSICMIDWELVDDLTGHLLSKHRIHMSEYFDFFGTPDEARATRLEGLAGWSAKKMAQAWQMGLSR